MAFDFVELPGAKVKLFSAVVNAEVYDLFDVHDANFLKVSTMRFSTSERKQSL